jgi:signal transduction histidine kinase
MALIERSTLRLLQCLAWSKWKREIRIPYRRSARCAAALLTAFTALLLPQSIAAGPDKDVRRVLVFNDLGSISSPGFSAVDQAIFAALQKSPYRIEFYNENLETTLFSGKDYQRELREGYIRKYRDRKPDVIIAAGQDSIKFMVESHATAFPNVPIIFCGSTEEMVDEMKPDLHFTGVWAVAQPEGTLRAALQLQPDTRHVVVVGGVGTFDRAEEGIVKKSLRDYESKLDFTYLTDLDMPTLLERLQHLPSHTIVIHTSIMEDAAGEHFIDASQSAPKVASAANAPVFVLDDVDLGNGTVGGYLLSWVATGRIAGEMALRVLNGERLENIAIVKSANSYLFDSRALRRWGLKERDLPPGSVLLYRQPSVWELYKSYIISAILLILAEALLIAGLVWQRLRRRKAESELAISHDRLRMAVEAGRFVGWDLDINKGQNRWFGNLEGMFGIPSETYFSPIGDFSRRVHPEDRDFVSQQIADARQSRQPYTAEFRFQRDDGAVRWIIARGRFYYANNGTPERMLGLAMDVTERKLAEEALSELSGRLIDAQEEERKRIAREIHDDYSQRLAMLSLELESLKEEIENAPTEAGPQIHKIWNAIGELGADLHSFSHRLHSSTLERLGLVAGVRVFVEEFAAQQQIKVSFSHTNVPRGVAEDVALCLFRVVQEGLRNIKRHSGADEAQVHIEGLGEKLHLSVVDQGRGFDVNHCSPRAGIGIRSMQERLRSLGGQLEITSRLTEGTRIDAFVPLRTASRSVA